MISSPRLRRKRFHIQGRRVKPLDSPTSHSRALIYSMDRPVPEKVLFQDTKVKRVDRAEESGTDHSRRRDASSVKTQAGGDGAPPPFNIRKTKLLAQMGPGIRTRNPLLPKPQQAQWRRRDVAQPGRALGLGPRRRRFKSCRPDHPPRYSSSMEPSGVELPPADHRGPVEGHTGRRMALGIRRGFSALGTGRKRSQRSGRPSAMAIPRRPLNHHPSPTSATGGFDGCKWLVTGAEDPKGRHYSIVLGSLRILGGAWGG